MKDWVKRLIKEHYPYKFHTLLMKSSAPPFYGQPPSHFHKKILIPLFYDFSEITLWSVAYGDIIANIN